MRIFYLILILLFTIALNVSAQKADNFKIVSESVLTVLRDNIIGDKIKDSTAVYTFSIQISIKKDKSKFVVNAEINNKEAKLFFSGLEEVKKVDYSNLMRNRTKANFVVSAYVLVYGSNYSDVIRLSELRTALKYLFVESELDQQNLGRVLIEFDKKVY